VALNLYIFKVLSDHMTTFLRSAGLEKARERIACIDTLKHQLLELEALREEVAEAERRGDAKRLEISVQLARCSRLFPEDRQ
jgi:hypothetical protein